MRHLPKLRPLILTWLAWAILMVGYQVYVRSRFEPARPDYALEWTPYETEADSQGSKPYLLEPFLNDHVSWDSEYYISIALYGYDDPAMRAIPPDFTWRRPQLKLKGEEPNWITQNYAFLPFYPLVMGALTFPLRVLGLNPVATATLAGVLVSMLGTLAAMVALYDIARDELGEAGGVRTAFYLLIWPAAMFLAQVYTEGLFLGLSFGAIAFARRDKWVLAALLAVCATWSRALGGLLIVPMIWYWLEQGHHNKLLRQFSWAELGRGLLLVSPLLAYFVWSLLLGKQFHTVESLFFSRGLLLINQSIGAWDDVIQAVFGRDAHPHAQAYYLIEFAAIIFSVIACIILLKRYPALVLYSAMVIVLSLTSGAAQGMHRYVMAGPVIFLLPARWGKHEAFDRVWTLGNVLLMGIFAAMFSFDFWAG